MIDTTDVTGDGFSSQPCTNHWYLLAKLFDDSQVSHASLSGFEALTVEILDLSKPLNSDLSLRHRFSVHSTRGSLPQTIESAAANAPEKMESEEWLGQATPPRRDGVIWSNTLLAEFNVVFLRMQTWKKSLVAKMCAMGGCDLRGRTRNNEVAKTCSSPYSRQICGLESKIENEKRRKKQTYASLFGAIAFGRRRQQRSNVWNRSLLGLELS